MNSMKIPTMRKRTSRIRNVPQSNEIRRIAERKTMLQQNMMYFFRYSKEKTASVMAALMATWISASMIIAIVKRSSLSNDSVVVQIHSAIETKKLR